MIAARDIHLCAEARFQRHRREPITCFRCNRPRADICGAKRSELPKRFIVKGPTGPFGRDGARNPCAYTMAHLLSRASLKVCVLAIQSEVIGIQRDALRKWPRRVDTPEADLVVGGIVEESR